MNIQQESQPQEIQTHVEQQSNAAANCNDSTLAYSDPLVERLNHVTSRRKICHNIANVSLLSILPLAYLIVIAGLFYSVLLAAALLFLYIALVTTMLVLVRTGSKAIRRAIDDMRNTENLGAIGPLLQAIEMADPKNYSGLISSSDFPSYENAVPILKRLLPKLIPLDAGLLNMYQRECINRALTLSVDPAQKKLYDLNFTIPILVGLSEIGGYSSLQYIKPLETLKIKGEKAEIVRELARSCTARIRARIEEAMQANQLLRPAGEQGETLLRTVQGTLTTSDSLLKPSDSSV
jgi:hypothetical protein